MTILDPIGDMLTRVRNGQLIGATSVVVPASRTRENVLKVLEKEGYIRGFSDIKNEKGRLELKVELKYIDGNPVIKKMQRVSKPSRRVYSSVSDLPLIFNGLGISILSTSKGIMSNVEARQQNVGGEIICSVF